MASIKSSPDVNWYSSVCCRALNNCGIGDRSCGMYLLAHGSVPPKHRFSAVPACNAVIIPPDRKLTPRRASIQSCKLRRAYFLSANQMPSMNLPSPLDGRHFLMAEGSQVKNLSSPISFALARSTRLLTEFLRMPSS